MSTRRADTILQVIAIVVMAIIWGWVFLGCSPVAPNRLDEARVQQIEIQKSVMQTQQRTIEAMHSQIEEMGRIIAVQDSSRSLCDSLSLKVVELSHRMRDNPFDAPHGRSDAQSILSVP